MSEESTGDVRERAVEEPDVFMPCFECSSYGPRGEDCPQCGATLPEEYNIRAEDLPDLGGRFNAMFANLEYLMEKMNDEDLSDEELEEVLYDVQGAVEEDVQVMAEELNSAATKVDDE